MAAPDQARKVASFGLFEADLHTGELRKRGVKIKLRDKSFELLAALLEHPGDVVTRKELQSRLWPSGVFVDFDNNLNTAITRLREALGDSADKPRFVETLPRRGYRFVAPVSVRQVGGYERPTGRVKLAVLPFENLSGDPGQEYFSDGMTEELITCLARVAPERFGVIARTSAMRYKRSRKDLIRIGRELDVDYILEGSVRRADDRVRISAQLIQVDLQTHLWAQSYDGDLRDALNLQRDIARAITNQMGLKLPSQVAQTAEGDRAIIAEAYDAYLLGVHQLSQGTPGGFAKAEEYFRLAMEKDSQFAPAYAKSATGHAMAGYFGYVS